jgi:hypothetical protein
MSRVIVPKGAVDLAIRQSGKFVKPQVEPRLLGQFKTIKEQMLKEFNTHQVTSELEQKTAADPSSFVSRGSLFGFIGFDKADEPIEIVREMLTESELKFIRFKGGIIDFKIFHPSKEELFEVTPLPWADGRSWLKGIESGISGLGRYLNIDYSEYSRSGGGIQSEHQIGSSRFKATSYISKILNNFIKKIDNLSL